MKNPYEELLRSLPVPEWLEERTLSAARRQASASEANIPRRRGRRMLQAAVCGVLSLVLVLGTLTLREPEAAGGTPDQGGQGGTALLSPAFSFGLTAYAADTGEVYTPNANSGLALSSSGGMTWSDGDGYFTGCLFQVTGENIQSLSLSLSQGQLYSWKQTDNLTEEEMEAVQAAQAKDKSLPPVVGTRQQNGRWSIEQQLLLGGEIEVEYDPEVRYGFWTEGLDLDAWQENPRAAAQESVDILDGAKLTVTVRFTDGSQDTQVYTLSTGLLKIETAADGTFTLLPQLPGEDAPALYGVYVVDQAKSRFLRWPLGENTRISMSAPFGSRDNPGGQGSIFHDGLDIPAPRGTEITAAAAGTVVKAAFDPKLGNFLVIDHGDGLETVCGCCSQLLVRAGDQVAEGQVIASVGSTGQSTGPHLHFGVRQDGRAQNPVAYFDAAVRSTLSVG